MTHDEFDDLRTLACALAPDGLVQARQVVILLTAYDRLKLMCAALAERCARQSELLSKRAEKPTGCTCGAGTAFGPMQGHWRHCELQSNAEKQSS